MRRSPKLRRTPTPGGPVHQIHDLQCGRPCCVLEPDGDARRADDDSSVGSDEGIKVNEQSQLVHVLKRVADQHQVNRRIDQAQYVAVGAGHPPDTWVGGALPDGPCGPALQCVGGVLARWECHGVNEQMDNPRRLGASPQVKAPSRAHNAARERRGAARRTNAARRTAPVWPRRARPGG